MTLRIAYDRSVRNSAMINHDTQYRALQYFIDIQAEEKGKKYTNIQLLRHQYRTIVCKRNHSSFIASSYLREQLCLDGVFLFLRPLDSRKNIFFDRTSLDRVLQLKHRENSSPMKTFCKSVKLQETVFFNYFKKGFKTVKIELYLVHVNQRTCPTKWCWTQFKWSGYDPQNEHMIGQSVELLFCQGQLKNKIL